MPTNSKEYARAWKAANPDKLKKYNETFKNKHHSKKLSEDEKLAQLKVHDDFKNVTTAAGIYQIKGFKSDKLYIGSAVNIKNRWRCHIYDLKLAKHGNVYLSAIYKGYGIEGLEFKILEILDNPSELIEKEQAWIDSLNTVAPNGYNVNPNAGSRLGTKHTIETRSKLLKARNLRAPISQETRDEMSRAHIGRIFTPEWREKLSKARLGIVFSEETRAKMSIAQKARKGKSCAVE